MAHVYHNGVDYIVAESEDDALAVLCEFTGYSAQEYRDHGLDPFRVQPEDAKKRVLFADDEEPTQGWPPFECVQRESGLLAYEATFAEWANWCGRGMLASSEW